ncbi:MAG TPA: anthranilate synthase component I family protein [Candidatus Limnocylindrales bacterium]|nr:anthranilate synthase component I family protein [Candidatus Limnocylindrales bacterium]
MTTTLRARVERRGAAAQVRVERLPELDGAAPMDVAERLRPLGGLTLLESARPGRNAIWSYVTAAPRLVLDRASGGSDPLQAARRAIRRLAANPAAGGAGPRFLGGLVGFLGYDLGRTLERIPQVAADDQPLPVLRLQLHDWALAHDRRDGSWWLGGRAFDGDAPELDRRLAAVRAALADDPVPHWEPSEQVPTLAFRSGLDRAAYESGVEAVRDAIARGEVYQANLTRRLEAPFGGDPWALYRRLRTGDPALFAAFLPLDATGRRAIASASPEPFLSVTSDGRVATDPIKGTRPRGLDREDDRRLARELLASAKDRAENVMIVDVLRNDLGRVCVPATVRVPRLCRLERTATVQHLVSTVTGQLAPGRDAFDLLLASFPGGSITGAPKIRVMQLLEGLEPVRRGPYTGAAGWIGPDGAMQTSILIRSFVADGRRLTLHVGGGITWRSDPAAEWQETIDKARGPLGAIGAVEVEA